MRVTNRDIALVIELCITFLLEYGILEEVSTELLQFLEFFNVFLKMFIIYNCHLGLAAYCWQCIKNEKIKSKQSCLLLLLFFIDNLAFLF